MADLDDLQRDWDSQPTYTDEKMNEVAKLVQTRAESLSAKLFQRDMVESLAALFIIFCFAPALLYVPVLAKVGICIAMAGAIEIAVLMNWVRSRARGDFAAMSLKAFLASELQGLDRQIALLRYVAWWYLLPLYAGVCLFILGLDYASRSPVFVISDYLVSIVFSSGYLVFCIFIWWINQRARKTSLEPLRAALQQTYDSVVALDTPLDEDELISALSNPALDGCPSSVATSASKLIWALIALLLLGGIAIGWSGHWLSHEQSSDATPVADQQLEQGDRRPEATDHFKDATSVDELVEPLIDSGTLRGVSVGVVSLHPEGHLQSVTHHYGQIEFAKGDDDSPRAPNDQTLYEIGGLSAVLTNTLLAAAIERGEVELDTPVSELVPPDVRIPDFNDKPITLLHLATHRSGLPRLADNMAPVDPQDPYQSYTAERAEAFLAGYQLEVAPGERSEYSNFAVGYLGYVLMKSAGLNDYDTLLTDRLTGPLEMTSTGVVLEDEASQLPIGYNRRGRQAKPWHFADQPGAGGVRSSIEDMNRFMRACIDEPNGPTGRAISIAFERAPAPSSASNTDRKRTVGWMLAGDQSTRWHNGATGGFKAMMFVNRERKVGVCVLSNKVSDLVDQLASRILLLQ